MLARLPEKWMYLILASTVALLLTLLYLVQTNPPRAHNEKIRTTNSAELAPLGLDLPNWLQDSPENRGTLESWKIQSAKIFFEVETETGTHFLVSQKKARDEREDKQGLWEFLGGNAEKNETPLETLLRELKEEDPTGILAAEVSRLANPESPDKLHYRLIQLDEGIDLALFRVVISLDTWHHIQKSLETQPPMKESFGFQLVPITTFDMSHSIKKMWTNRSRRILNALRA